MNTRNKVLKTSSPCPSIIFCCYYKKPPKLQVFFLQYVSLFTFQKGRRKCGRQLYRHHIRETKNMLLSCNGNAAPLWRVDGALSSEGRRTPLEFAVPRKDTRHSGTQRRPLTGEKPSMNAPYHSSSSCHFSTCCTLQLAVCRGRCSRNSR